MTHLFRSLIFVPGNNPRFLEKAKKLQADIVCFDLEDSVPDEEKKNARKLIQTALKSPLKILVKPLPATSSLSLILAMKKLKLVALHLNLLANIIRKQVLQIGMTGTGN